MWYDAAQPACLIWITHSATATATAQCGHRLCRDQDRLSALQASKCKYLGGCRELLEGARLHMHKVPHGQGLPVDAQSSG